MKAAHSDQLKLLSVQELDTQIGTLTRHLNEVSEQKAAEAVDRALLAIAPEFIRLSGEVDDVASQIERCEDDVAVVDARIAQDGSKLAASVNPKEALGLEHELETLARRKEELEERELELMKLSEEVSGARDEIARQREALTLERASITDVVQKQRSEIETQIAECRRSREVAVHDIPGDLYELYEKQRSRYGIGAATLISGVSGGSGMQLSAHELERISALGSDEIVLCPDSNCILVRLAPGESA